MLYSLGKGDGDGVEGDCRWRERRLWMSDYTVGVRRANKTYTTSIIPLNRNIALSQNVTESTRLLTDSDEVYIKRCIFNKQQ